MSGTKGKFLPSLQVLLLAFSSVKAVSFEMPCCILDNRFGEFCPTTCGVSQYFGRHQAQVDSQLGEIEKSLNSIGDTTVATNKKMVDVKHTEGYLNDQQSDQPIQTINEMQREVLGFERSTDSREVEINELELILNHNKKEISDLKEMRQQLQGLCRKPCQDTVHINEITGQDCQSIADNGATKSGLYYVKPLGARRQFLVYCEIESNGRGWTLLQRRLDGSVDFNRNWIPYKEGFGYLSPGDTTEFWLGNEKMHLLTTRSMKNNLIQIDLKDWEGNHRYAQYVNFQVSSEVDKYRLSYGMYLNGDAGDSLGGFDFGDHPSDKLYTSQNYAQFSTPDSDNDKYEENCAAQDQVGWWMNRCYAANLNGKYHKGGEYTSRDTTSGFNDGIIWATWKNRWYSLKEVSMKIIPFDRYNAIAAGQFQVNRGDA
ncbi:fibrinogen gamma chain [Scyliorhinus canicula]|uniref:fibrinogen gamma chain n=1 Tax=Scyliorhinus canicula TaxID=7830 RepID=UPI0018F5ED07|nr:fibrinogen gamma chain [Scyliorhinus canicula]